MNATIDKQIADAEAKLTLLLIEVRETPVAARVQAWTARMCGGKKISEYLHDEAIAVKDRVMVAKALVDILIQKEFSRLPVVEAPTPAPVAVAETPDIMDDISPAQLEVFRQIARSEARRALADVLESIARVLREP